MKKAILLFMFSLTALVAIEFTMTKEGLFTETTVQSTTPEPSPMPTTEPINVDVDISNIQISDISSRSVKITWNGNPNAQTWIAHEPYNSSGSKHDATNNQYTYSSLASDTTFTVYVKGIGSDVILEKIFTTKQDGNSAEPTQTPEPTPTPTPTPTPIPNPSQTSSYLEPIILPTCDTNNPEVQFIQNNNDWKHINDNNKRIFCVSPGDYRSLKNINLTASGTENKKRYIILNNGNDLHPGKLGKESLANYSLLLNNVDYWVIDRLSSFNHSIHRTIIFRNGSEHNIINRAFTDNITTSVIMYNNVHNNTIQNSRFQNMRESARKNDNCAILFYEYKGTHIEMKNNKIINNEIVNANDGFQIARQTIDGILQVMNCEGTIIDGNDMYLTSDIYTDGKGNYTKNGEYAFAENALDLKAASDNINNPVIITNNHFWGWRRSDKSGTSHNDDAGYALGTHFNTPNMIIEDNIIFDSAGGMNSGDSRNYKLALENTSIKRNLFYSCGSYPKSSNRQAYALQLTEADTTIIQNNTIINPRAEYALIAWNKEKIIFTNNEIINTSLGAEIRNNMNGTYAPNYIYPSTEESGYTEDYVFTTDNFTNLPRTIVLKNARKK